MSVSGLAQGREMSKSSMPAIKATPSKSPAKATASTASVSPTTLERNTTSAITSIRTATPSLWNQTNNPVLC